MTEDRQFIPSIQKELARLRRYDEEISKEMPKDYKDWWENSKEEYPLIARLSLEGRREQVEWCYDVIDKQTEKIKELEEKIKDLKELVERLDWELQCWEQTQ